MNRILAYSLVLIFSISFKPILFAKTKLNGAGASFPYPLYSKWFSEYAKDSPETLFNYQAIGSGGGVRQVIAQTVDFGASDVPLRDKDKKKAKFDILQIPTTIGAVVVTYNVEEIEQGLKLDAQTLAKIFTGQITKWNDNKIQELNPNLNLPAKDILVVRRSDGSGTTAIFTGYLSAIDTTFEKVVGAGKAVKWPVGVGGKGNDGVTAMVKQMDGAIGYVELAYAITNQLNYAQLKNRAGKFIEPQISNISSSAKSFMQIASTKKELVGAIFNSEDPQAYPITSFTYLLIPATIKKKGKYTQMKAFVDWAMTKGQSMAKKLHYAPLPKELATLVKRKVSEL
jgi:phosphate transport system substrate-binding protein